MQQKEMEQDWEEHEVLVSSKKAVLVERRKK